MLESKICQIFKSTFSYRTPNWINPKTLSTEQPYHRRKIRESLEIKKAKTNKRRKVLNRDEGNLVKTNTWTPLFAKLTEKETNTKT